MRWRPGGDDPFAQVIDAAEVWSPVGDRQRATTEMRLEHRARHGPQPGARHPPVTSLGRRQRRGGEWTARADFTQHETRVARVARQEAVETVRARTVREPPVAQQRVGGHRHDRCLVGPVFGELAPAIDQFVEARSVIRPDARERHLVLRRHQDVDVVDLEQSKLMDDPPQMTDVDPAMRARTVEPLRRQSHTASLARRQVGAGHDP